MSGWIPFLCFVLLGAADTVFSVKLNLSPWPFLLAGNPVQPDGRKVYDTEQFRSAAGMLCAIYAGAFFMTALSVLLTQILCIMPDGLMAAMLYVHGAVLVLTAFGMLAYLDTYCQVDSEKLPE